MDENNHGRVSTISSPLETGQLTSYAAPKIDRQKAEQLSILLRRLAAAYYNPNFTQEQAAIVIADYILDLAEFSIRDVEDAVRAYRLDAKSEFFPKPGALYKLASLARRERQAKENHRPVKAEFNRPHLWWALPKVLWQSGWRENEVPYGEMVKEERGGTLRQPNRQVHPRRP